MHCNNSIFDALLTFIMHFIVKVYHPLFLPAVDKLCDVLLHSYGLVLGYSLQGNAVCGD